MKDITLYFDIETNAVEDFATLAGVEKIHCMSVYNPISQKMTTFTTDTIHMGLAMLGEARYVCGHNIINFDLPVMKKLLNWQPNGQVLDTLVTSRCMHSDIRGVDMQRGDDFPKELWGSHSLKAWGWRLGLTKGNYGEQEHAWDSYNEDMKEYCERDVLVTVKLAQFLKEDDPSVNMLTIEHRFANIIRRQELRGFEFNSSAAQELLQTLTVRRAELRDELQTVFPPTHEEMKTAAGWTLNVYDSRDNHVMTVEAKTKAAVKERLKQLGLKQVLVKDAKKQGNKIKSTPFNPGSREQIASRLKALGWEPSVFTPDGRAKIDEGVLKGINHPSAVKLLEYLMVVKRLGQLAEGKNGWLNCVQEGRIHGQVNTNGAVTGRCTHNSPNVAQVPAVRAEYGKECRALFTAGEGYDLVGVDASGLELRCLAHYLALFDGGEYGRYLLEDDIHSVNQNAAGLETRDQAKTFIYAFLYGAGDAKIGDIVGGTAKDGKQLKTRFLAKTPALARLKKIVEERVKKYGFLKGIDGRILPIRSEHAALNTLLQSCGAVAMKQSLVRCDTALRRLGWQYGEDWAWVANIHDEFQAEVNPDKAEDYGKIAVKSIRQAGDDLRFNCPLDGEYKVGKNWADTH